MSLCSLGCFHSLPFVPVTGIWLPAELQWRRALLHCQEPPQEYQVQVQGKASVECSRVCMCGGDRLHAGGCWGPKGPYDSSVLQASSSGEGRGREALTGDPAAHHMPDPSEKAGEAKCLTWVCVFLSVSLHFSYFFISHSDVLYRMIALLDI